MTTMGKTTRRLSVLALCTLLGCASGGSDQKSTGGIGDGEEPGAAPAASKGAPEVATAAAEPSRGSADSSAMARGSAASPTPSSSASGMAAAAPTTPSAPASGPASSPAAPSGAPSSATPPAAASGAAGSGASASAPLPPSSDAKEVGGGRGQVAASVLTAGAWDDNRNFERFTKYRKQLQQQELKGLLATTDEEHASAHDAFSKAQLAREQLDVALIIDTTGSMGDEISYLQSEFLALSSAIESKYPNAEQRWALVLYRDHGDEYVTRWFDFRDSAEDFRDKLAMQAARGGGDFPEAPDAALETMAQLGWRSEERVARLAFWVADAPHHTEKAAAMLAAIRGAREQGIHLYPVASSGVDELTEISMRSAAQLTGGRYLFLTDDSGVGGAHKEPSIPCYFVTKLDKAILRMVDIEMTGKYSEPATDDIIRKSGEPENGSCDLQSGETVQAF